MWYQDLVRGAAKVTQDVVALVVQQDVFNLPTGQNKQLRLTSPSKTLRVCEE